MTILITGSNGFLGQYFYNTQAFSKYNVIYGTTSEVIHENYRKFLPCYSDIDSILADESVDIIIHLASKIPASFASADSDLFLDNTKMMVHLSEFA